MSTRSDGGDPGGAGDAEGDRLLEEFRRHAAADQAALHQALRRADLPAVARLAHRLRGACQLVGAVAFAAFCADLETAARRGDAEAVTALRRRLPGARARLDRYVARRGAAAGRTPPSSGRQR